MTVTRSPTAYTDKVTLANTGNAAATNANLGVYDNGTLVGSVTGVNLAPGARRVFAVRWKLGSGPAPQSPRSQIPAT